MAENIKQIYATNEFHRWSHTKKMDFCYNHSHQYTTRTMKNPNSLVP